MTGVEYDGCYSSVYVSHSEVSTLCLVRASSSFALAGNNSSFDDSSKCEQAQIIL